MTQVWELRLRPCTFTSFSQHLFLTQQFLHSVQVALMVIGSFAECWCIACEGLEQFSQRVVKVVGTISIVLRGVEFSMHD